ncbi:hypothetical protein [Leifsonia sp. A12D58]|uniref:hypothetical protein n=1 Tax=Leifsonia sp. A12D58 TaxID=3397674 RepID=UPI0039DF89EC
MTIAATIAPPVADAAQRGRTRITSKALKSVVSAVTAEALGVDANHVGVDLTDHSGALAVTVTTPIRVVSLDRVQSDPTAVKRAGGSIVDRTSRAQETIRDRVSNLTGSTIGRVTVRISGVNIQPEERVT